MADADGEVVGLELKGAVGRLDVDTREDGERGVGTHSLGDHGESLHEGTLAYGEFHGFPFYMYLMNNKEQQ